jgi:hypothetical protein
LVHAVMVPQATFSGCRKPLNVLHLRIPIHGQMTVAVLGKALCRQSRGNDRRARFTFSDKTDDERA